MNNINVLSEAFQLSSVDDGIKILPDEELLQLTIKEIDEIADLVAKRLEGLPIEIKQFNDKIADIDNFDKGNLMTSSIRLGFIDERQRLIDRSGSLRRYNELLNKTLLEKYKK